MKTIELTREDIIRMASEAYGDATLESIQDFAAFAYDKGIEAEREACKRRNEMEERIQKFAKEAGIDEVWWQDELKRFATLVAAAEREECAKVCDAEVIKLGQSREALVAGICAASIRARGEGIL